MLEPTTTSVESSVTITEYKSYVRQLEAENDKLRDTLIRIAELSEPTPRVSTPVNPAYIWRLAEKALER